MSVSLCEFVWMVGTVSERAIRSLPRCRTQQPPCATMLFPDTPGEAQVSIFVAGCLMAVIDFGAFLLIWFTTPLPLFVLMLVKVLAAHRYHYALYHGFPHMYTSPVPSVLLYSLLVPIIGLNMVQWFVEWFVLPGVEVVDSLALSLLFYLGLAAHLVFFAIHLALYCIYPPPHDIRDTMIHR